MPEVSIILPVYNTGKYLDECIRSILNQSFHDFELLMIDDQSEDDSFRIMNAYSDPRIKTFSVSHRGLSAVRNFGIGQARGNFLYFMDSDDWIEPHLLQNNIDFIDREQLDFVIFGYYRDYRDAQENFLSGDAVTPERIEWKKGRKNLFAGGDHLDLLGYAWNKLYRTSFLNKFRPRFETGTTLIEDILFNCEVFQNTDRICFNDSAWYHYINRPQKSLLKTFYPNAFLLTKRKWLALKKWITEWDVKNGRQLLSYSLVSGIRYCVYNLFGVENDLSYQQKVDYVRMMFDDLLTRQALPDFVPDSPDMLVYQSLIENRLVTETCDRAIRMSHVPEDSRSTCDIQVDDIPTGRESYGVSSPQARP